MVSTMSSSKHCCKKLYRFRWFHSKGAALVLVWISLVTAAHYSFVLILKQPFYGEKEQVHLIKRLCILTLLSAPFFGWLADAKLGNYRVLKIGLILSFIASLLNSIYCLLYYNTLLREYDFAAVKGIFLASVIVFQWIGAITSFISSIQLGLDQLPDGSTENITSLISWTLFALFGGVWIGHVIRDIPSTCALNNSVVYQVIMLLPVVFTSIVLCLYYILSPKWLIIEPKAPQSLTNIFRVLKFAAKHKAPLNRSALTYWEEDVPSRLDFGKARFGGPFTTEQVEDVKTFFRLLTVNVPLFLIVFGTRLYQKHEPIAVARLSDCKSTALSSFSFGHWWCAMVATAVYELVIYPCLNYRLPSLLKRIGFAAFAFVLKNSLLLVMIMLDYFNYADAKAQWLAILLSILEGVLVPALFQATLEFICAQSPYNMRGLLTGYFLLFYLAGDNASLDSFWDEYCKRSYCPLIVSIAAALNIFGFVLYLIIAHWYKMRVRDNEYPQQAVVEEVYDRYLSAQNTRQLSVPSYND